MSTSGNMMGESMQNNKLSLLTALCLSTAFVALPAVAQEEASPMEPVIQENIPTPQTEQPAVLDTLVQSTALGTPEIPVADNPTPTEVAEGQVPNSPMEKPAQVQPTADQSAETQTTADQSAETQTTEGQPVETLSPEEIEQQQKTAAVDKLLGDNVAVNTDKIVDFPGRPSMGSIEMATLPGINESLINGPTPMGESLSSKDMPSEQLLGRITTEVFHEMADLERGNVFLNLQTQKEKLKNDLEDLKAKYRQARLEEIAKREDVVRSRINWWQEQENIRIEMERKKAETEAIEQQIAEAEELREKLRNEAIADRLSADTISLETIKTDEDIVADAEEKQVKEKEVTPTLTQAEPEEVVPQAATDLYSLIGVRGLKGRLTARLENKEDGSVLTVKKGQKLKTGHKVVNIERDTIQLSYAGRLEVIILATAAASPLE